MPGTYVYLFFLFPFFSSGPVCFPQPVCFGYYQIPERVKSRSHLSEHNCNDNLWKPWASEHVWKDQRLHRLVPKQILSEVNQTGTPTAKENAPMLTCFHMSHILVLCSVLLELLWRAWSCTCQTWQMRSWGCQVLWWVVSRSPAFLITNGISSLFFSLRIVGKPGKVSYDFFFLQNRFFFFFKDYFIWFTC